MGLWLGLGFSGAQVLNRRTLSMNQLFYNMDNTYFIKFEFLQNRQKLTETHFNDLIASLKHASIRLWRRQMT